MKLLVVLGLSLSFRACAKRKEASGNNNKKTDKAVISQIKCGLCHYAIPHVMSWYQMNTTFSDPRDDRADQATNGICSQEEFQGRYLAQLDIIKPDIEMANKESVTLQMNENYRVCDAECRLLARACREMFDDEDSLQDAIAAEHSLKKTTTKVCKKHCRPAKKFSKIENWVDEPFVERDMEEQRTKDLLKTMKRDTGMPMKMYSRDELDGMSEHDFEAMAVREQYAQERMAAQSMEF